MPSRPPVRRPLLRSAPAQPRKTNNQRGYDHRWHTARTAYLVAYPVCVECGRQATCVDHRIPVRGQADPLFWDEENWQAMCTICHSIKTAKEDGGFGNKGRRR